MYSYKLKSLLPDCTWLHDQVWQYLTLLGLRQILCPEPTSVKPTECDTCLLLHFQRYHSILLQIINLSSVSRILERNNPQVYEYGFPATLSPSLESICSISRTVASWLQRTRDHVVVFHCKGGIDRLACVLAAYVNYSSIYDG